MIFDDGFDALGAGAAYALYRHGQDKQAEQIAAAVASQPRNSAPSTINVNVTLTDDEDQQGLAPINWLDFSTSAIPESWDDYIGQEPLKRQLMVAVSSAKARDAALPHVLLASGMPGVGKTTMARLLAKTMGVEMIEIVPPFNIYTLAEAAKMLFDKDILFIDEVHKLGERGKRGAEILLKVLEDKVAYLPNGEVVELSDITVIGATTDKDMLPEPVVDRFPIKPYFQKYSLPELARITIVFASRHGILDEIDDDLAVSIALACRETPRLAEELIIGARDLLVTFGQPPTADELLAFMELEPDGMSRQHIAYITALRQYFARKTKDGTIEYIIGEAAMQQLLRETKQGVARIERFLIERGLLDRTPRGRRLTDRGIARAEEFIAAGKGVSLGE